MADSNKKLAILRYRLRNVTRLQRGDVAFMELRNVYRFHRDLEESVLSSSLSIGKEHLM